MPTVFKLSLLKRPGNVVLARVTSIQVKPEQIINGWDYAAKYRAGLEKVQPIERVDLIIDSAGGSTESACGIVEALEELEKPVRVLIDGRCDSAATLIAFSHPVTTAEITPSASIFLHNPTICSYRRTAGVWNMVKKIGNITTAHFFAATYAARTGKTKAQCKQWMKAGTRFDAQQAVDQGFCSRIVQRYEWEQN